MRVMIIEDDNNKLKAISDFLTQFGGIEYCNAKSWHSGVKALSTNRFDLLLLDMSIPCYDGPPQDEGRPLALGGRDMLFYLRRNNIPFSVIIITQYENFGGTSLKELDSEFQREFPQHYMGFVYYNITQDKWKDDLAYLLNCRRTRGEGEV